MLIGHKCEVIWVEPQDLMDRYMRRITGEAVRAHGVEPWRKGQHGILRAHGIRQTGSNKQETWAKAHRERVGSSMEVMRHGVRSRRREGTRMEEVRVTWQEH